MPNELQPETVTVHAQEKVSTGEYESAQYNLTIEFDAEELDGTEIREQYLQKLKQVQKDVETAAMNRVKIPDAEEWLHEVE